MGVNDWDGTRALALLRERMNRLFDERQARGASAVEGAFAPATDVYSTDDTVFVAVELPGVAAERRRRRGPGARAGRARRGATSAAARAPPITGSSAATASSAAPSRCPTTPTPTTGACVSQAACSPSRSRGAMSEERQTKSSRRCPRSTSAMFVMSLASSVLVHLGEIEHPDSRERDVEPAVGQADHRHPRHAARKDARQPDARGSAAARQSPLRSAYEVCGCEKALASSSPPPSARSSAC